MDPKFSRRTVLSAVGAVTLVNTAASGAVVATEETEALRERDTPVREAIFTVELDGTELAGVRTVTIPSFTAEEVEYRESDDAEYAKKTWGQPSFDDLEMERGFDPDSTELVRWRRAIQAGKADEGRKEIAVKLLDEEGEMQLQWEFRQAWIREYDPPELDTSAEGDVTTESITVAFDRMKREEV